MSVRVSPTILLLTVDKLSTQLDKENTKSEEDDINISS